MVGSGGAVSSVDRDASQVGIDVLARGGNAADAAVATAAALGRHRALQRRHRRRRLPRLLRREDQEGLDDRRPRDGADVVHRRRPSRTRDRHGPTPSPPRSPPGSPSEPRALRRSGTRPPRSSARGGSGSCCKPAEQLAAERLRRRPDVLRPDRRRTQARFAPVPGHRRGLPARNGSRRPSARPSGTRTWPGLQASCAPTASPRSTAGSSGEAVVAEAQHPSTSARRQRHSADSSPSADLAAYRALDKAPITSQYKGFDVYGMPVPSSGGIAVAEILNLIEAYEKKTGTSLSQPRQRQLPALVLRGHRDGLRRPEPLRRRRSRRPGQGADQRRVRRRTGLPVFDPTIAQTRPIPCGTPDGSYAFVPPGRRRQGEPYEGQSTTHLVTADKWGNVASYTLTIEQTGGSGITVPGYGFLLNNELTDFNFTPLSILPDVPDPNLPGTGQAAALLDEPDDPRQGRHSRTSPSARPAARRSSPRSARPSSATSTATCPSSDAIAAPRLSSRNGAEGAEPPILTGP